MCRGRGHGHREGRAGPGHMTHREMGDWPIGLMTSHHSDNRFCSSGGQSFKKHTKHKLVQSSTLRRTQVCCVFLSHLAGPAGARCVIQRWCETVCVVGFITAITHQQHSIIPSQPNTHTHILVTFHVNSFSVALLKDLRFLSSAHLLVIYNRNRCF